MSVCMSEGLRGGRLVLARSLDAPWLGCLFHVAPQVKEVPPAAAAWADEFSTQQRQQGPAVWGEEFAAFQAQQHPAAMGKQWAQDFEGGQGQGRGSRARFAGQAAPCVFAHPRLCCRQPQSLFANPAGAADWADQFAESMLGGGAWAEEFADGRGSTGEWGIVRAAGLCRRVQVWPAAGCAACLASRLAQVRMHPVCHLEVLTPGAACSAPAADIASWEQEYLAELERLHGVAGAHASRLGSSPALTPAPTAPPPPLPCAAWHHGAAPRHLPPSPPRLPPMLAVHNAAGPRAAGAYVFAEDNPFLLDTDSFAKGKDLFRRGVLTGAAVGRLPGWWCAHGGGMREGGGRAAAGLPRQPCASIQQAHRQSST